MPTTLINPTNERTEEASTPAPRLPDLRGTTIALLDISKPGGAVFLDRLEYLLKERHGVVNLIRAMKPTFAKPAPPDVLERLRGADAVVEALAD